MTHAVNWQLSLDLGQGVARMMVAPRRPAKIAGIASGDYVVSINGITFEAFSAKPPPVGAVTLIEVFDRPSQNPTRNGSSPLCLTSTFELPTPLRYIAQRHRSHGGGGATYPSLSISV